MTKKTAIQKNIYYRKEKKGLSPILTLFACFFVFMTSLFLSDKIAHSVRSGLSLCAKVIIPSVFPFIVLSDFLYAHADFSSLNRTGAFFEKLFKINRVGIYPFMLGILCGFPLGVKCAKELYGDAKLTKDEAERIIGFCNNTGPAFLVSGIGLGLRGNILEGFLLYFVMVGSAVITGIIFSKSSDNVDCNVSFSGSGKFSFTESIKSAGISTLVICSYLTFFACVVGLLRNTIGENLIYILLVPLLEVGSAASILSKTKVISDILTLSLTSFAVGFSGFSVHFQALSYLDSCDLSTKRYFLMKITQGILSFLLTFIISFIARL